jgi:hypothetical protein
MHFTSRHFMSFHSLIIYLLRCFIHSCFRSFMHFIHVMHSLILSFFVFFFISSFILNYFIISFFHYFICSLSLSLHSFVHIHFIHFIISLYFIHFIQFIHFIHFIQFIHFISFHVMSCHVISFILFISFHVFHVMSWHVISLIHSCIHSFIHSFVSWSFRVNNFVPSDVISLAFQKPFAQSLMHLATSICIPIGHWCLTSLLIFDTAGLYWYLNLQTCLPLLHPLLLRKVRQGQFFSLVVVRALNSKCCSMATFTKNRVNIRDMLESTPSRL